MLNFPTAGLAQHSSSSSDSITINSIPEQEETVPSPPAENPVAAPTPPSAGSLSSQECVSAVREASHKSELAKIDTLLEQCLAAYEKEAKKQQAVLSNFPARGQEAQFQTLNDVAIILFTKGEALMDNGKKD